MRFGAILSLVLASFLTVQAAASASIPKATHVNAELLADVSAIQPGQPFTVGVKFSIAPNWHIYWINPGDAGESTQVKFDLPPGFMVGELMYPVPRVIRSPGDIVTYGYDREVMLLARVTPPKELSPNTSVKIAAHAEWLECENICIPGESVVTLDLPVAERAKEANRELFERWRRALPYVFPSAGPFVKSRATTSGREYELTFAWHGAAKHSPQFLPGPSDDVTFRVSELTTNGDAVTVRFNVEPLKGRSIPSSPIRCVITFNKGPSMDPEGAAFDIPMNPAPSTGPATEP
jgi:DsbC/DsbD-like thiol-disulfide interchange protein